MPRAKGARLPAHPRRLAFARADHGPLGSNAAHRFAVSHAMAIYRPEAVFTFIPKNACSMMRFSIAAENGCVASLDDVHWIHRNNHTFVPTLGELLRARFTFVILRDPFERLRSCFLDKIVRMEPNIWVVREETGRGFEPSELTFRSFVDLVANNPTADHHWRPQSDFLVYETYDAVFHMKDLSGMAAVLEERLGMTLHDVRDRLEHQVGHLEATGAPGAYADTPVHRLAAMRREGAAPSLEALHDGALVKTVERLYRQDLRLYARHTGLAPALSAGPVDGGRRRPRVRGQ